MLAGTGACKYASKRLKADAAAQPKGCSVCFVPRPQNQYRKLNSPTKGAHIQLRVPSGKSAVFTDSKLYLRVQSGKCTVFTDSKLYLRVPSGKCAVFTDSKLYLRIPSGKSTVFTDRTFINRDFPLSHELRCTLLSLKVLKMSILQKRQFISELPLCSPRGSNPGPQH